jgi:molybdopterin-guanine dinucleotide biosynthesis protein A
MGRDKALLPWKSGVLAEEIAGKLSVVTETVALVGNPSRYGHLGYPCLSDLRGGLGPLGGIEAALDSARGDLNLILACDMPEVDAAHLSRLLEFAATSREDCVVTQDMAGAIHPLCAVYRSTCLPVIRKALDEGRLKLRSVVEELRAKTILLADHICNINTEEEWNAVRSTHGY